MGLIGRATFVCLKEALLRHDHPEMFVQPQYGGIPVLYVAYRVFIAMFFAAMTLLSGLTFGGHIKWFIYLTHWSFSVLTLNVILQAVYVMRHYYRKRTPVGWSVEKTSPMSYCTMPVAFKLIWVLQNITVTIAPLVSAIYWTVVFRPGETPLGMPTIATHVLNTVYVLFDMCVTGVPMYASHVYHTLVYGIVYVSFTVIYWANGGTSVHGDTYIYTVLDYDSHYKRTTVIWVCGVFVAVICLHATMYGLYRLRVYIYKRCKRPNDDKDEDGDDDDVKTKMTTPVKERADCVSEIVM